MSRLLSHKLCHYYSSRCQVYYGCNRITGRRQARKQLPATWNDKDLKRQQQFEAKEVKGLWQVVRLLGERKKLLGQRKLLGHFSEITQVFGDAIQISERELRYLLKLELGQFQNLIIFFILTIPWISLLVHFCMCFIDSVPLKKCLHLFPFDSHPCCVNVWAWPIQRL